MTRIAEIRKTLVALAGLITQAVALGVLHGEALHWAQLVLAALTAAGVFLAPNADKKV